MRYGIVEGEPGIFPAPIASLMRKIGSFFDRRSDREPEPATPDEPGPGPKAAGGGDQPSGEQAAEGTGQAGQPDEPPSPGKATGDQS